MMRAGALAVMREQETLNRINVFPVPDADTGANLAATLRAAAAALGTRPGARAWGRPRAPPLTAPSRALAATRAPSSRSSSTASRRPWPSGTASTARSSPRPRFGAAPSRPTRPWRSRAKARSSPCFGPGRARSRAGRTRMTSRRCCTAASSRRATALAETQHQLRVLAPNHVVDAGGQGFVYFLEGLVDALRGRGAQLVPAEAPPRGLPAVLAAHEEFDERFRFCSEVLLAAADGAALSRDAVVAAVGGLGDRSWWRVASSGCASTCTPTSPSASSPRWRSSASSSAARSTTWCCSSSPGASPPSPW